MTTENPLEAIQRILSGGLSSKRLDAYLEYRKLIVSKLGDDAAPIFTVQHVRDGLLKHMKKEIARQYKSNPVVCQFACAFYASEITMSTPMTDLAKLVSSHPGRDFGMTNLDALAAVIVGITGEDVVFNGNVLRYSHALRFQSFEDVREFINTNGGRI